MDWNNNWPETKQRFQAWWKQKETDRPLMWVTAVRECTKGTKEEHGTGKPVFDDTEDYYTNVEKLVEQYRHTIRTRHFLADSFRNLDLNLGAGSMALYLGGKPNFAWDTVWFNGLEEDRWGRLEPLVYDPDNIWWKRHLAMLKEAKELSKGEFAVNIPDIVENADILAALRGTQNLLYDFIDRPDMISAYLKQIDKLYFTYYDAIYDLVKGEDGSSVYTAFRIWGPGRTAKVQCDFCAMLSPALFREYIVPSLWKQCGNLDNSLYHLDGPDAIKHVDALLEIEELDAIQWTSGAGKPDGGDEIWYPLYDKVVNADKSLHISIYQGNVNDWIDKSAKLVKRYGSKHLYLLFPEMSEKEAAAVLSAGEHNFNV